MKIVIAMYRVLLRLGAIVLLSYLLLASTNPQGRTFVWALVRVYLAPAALLVVLKRTLVFFIKKPRG